MKRVLVGTIIGAVLLFSGGYVIGQETAVWKSYQTQLANANVLMSVDSKWKGAAGISAVYKKALKDPTAARAVAERALVVAQSPDEATRASVELQALQVMQNQRIIELLEKKR